MENGVIAYSELQFHIKDSDLSPHGIHSLNYPTEVLIENSRVIGGVGGELKSLIIRNSHFEGQGPQRADYVLVEDSAIHINMSKAVFAHFKNIKHIDRNSKSMGIGTAKNLVIDGCQNPLDLTLWKSHIGNLFVRNCELIDPFFEDVRVGQMQLCNVQLSLN
ncbi:hypothetical protein [Candidatus Vondammii sp. HM_W22]|uniref:hypothetical protein n=1 Tax=Candidatus Vondammii sp. HM_W22 TaxID=2687299 RepID=UPI002E7B3C8E|nr:hypothetical protein [Candidatus Vondammii sp. HM_W22]